MNLTINSRTLGREITFSRPRGGYYIYTDTNGQPGALGEQICDGGRRLGKAIGYAGDDRTMFERICRRWYRAHVRRRNG